MANAFATLGAGLWEDGATVTGSDLRRGAAVALLGTTGATVRGGVKPARGNPLGVTAPGGMFARVAAGTGAVPGGTSEGAYVLTVTTNTDLAVTAANGTNPRIDTVGLEVVPGSPTTWRVRMLDGTPAASPSAPTYAVAGGFFLPLADVRVNALATSPTSITDRRAYTVAPGGVLYWPGFRSLAGGSQTSAMALLPQGTAIWDETNAELGIVSSTGVWKAVPLDRVQFGGKWTGAAGVPSDTTDRTIGLTAFTAGSGVGASLSDLTANRVVVPYTGIYSGLISCIWPVSSAGSRYAVLEIDGASSGTGKVEAAITGNTTRQFIPYQERLTAGQTLGVRVWQTSGGALTPAVTLAVQLGALG